MPEARTLFLNGTIAEESWFDDDVTPQLFKDELMAGSGDITVWINSPGGDCVAAAQIYNMLMDYKGNVTVKIDGIAASAASVIAMAGTKVLMSPVSMMMIHNPISTNGFNAVEAKSYLQGQGYNIETKQEKFELIITAESVDSTDERFTMDNLSIGDHYKPLGAYFRKASGEEIKRTYSKGERRNSNQTLPRIACQVFEKQISSMVVEDKENFPVCKYNPSSEMICGIYSSVEEFKQHRNTIEYLTYSYDNGRQFVIYCWNIFPRLSLCRNA